MGKDIYSDTLTQIEFTMKGSSDLTSGKYYLKVVKGLLDTPPPVCQKKEFQHTDGLDSLITINSPCAFNLPTLVDVVPKRRWIELFDSSNKYMCTAGSYRIKVKGAAPDSCNITIKSNDSNHPGCLETDDTSFLKAENVIVDGNNFTGKVTVWVDSTSFGSQANNGTLERIDLPQLSLGNHEVKIRAENFLKTLICGTQFVVKNQCDKDEITLPQGETGYGKDIIPVGPEECTVTQIVAFGSVVRVPGIKTAIGCIPYDPGNLVKWLLGFGLSLAGGIAFLLMTWGACLYITSQGNPDQLQKAKETIVSAIAGLLFIIFAVFLLRLIGVDILKIPGFQ